MTTPHTPFYIGIDQMPATLHGGRPGEVPPRLRLVGVPAGQPAGVLPLAGHGEGHREGVAADRGEGLGRPGRRSRPKRVALYKKDPKKARELLTKYTHGLANEAVSAYWKLGEDLWLKYSGNF
ncbi:MAG: hypothetical protein M0C28_45180 [Candidatus Moduliflexus flocculans]|nr:hypothetical protein [Candidatus Moduliflexus flocculans]